MDLPPRRTNRFPAFPPHAEIDQLPVGFFLRYLARSQRRRKTVREDQMRLSTNPNELVAQ